MSLIVSVFGHPLLAALTRIVGLAFLAGGVTTVAAFVYRVRARTQLPEGATVILGLGAVAIYLNTRLIFVQFISQTGATLTVSDALLNIAVFLTAAIASYGGRTVGDRAGKSKQFSLGRFQSDFNPIVRAVGRHITVTLPEEIDDIEGYDPVRNETKAALAGQTLEFPRGLTVAELQSQLVGRLKEDHDVGYVDVELTADGTVEFFAVGRRVSGLGPTMPPNAAAVALRADPPFSASAGDTVQLWRTPAEGESERLGTAELRASVDGVATVATDHTLAERVDPTVEHRLMTLAADSHVDREFAAMLRRSDETMNVVEVTDSSSLAGVSVGALDVTIIAVRSAGGDVETIPKRARVVQPGDHLFAIGRPEALRKLEAANGVHATELPDGEAVATEAISWDVSPTDGELLQPGRREN